MGGLFGCILGQWWEMFRCVVGRWRGNCLNVLFYGGGGGRLSVLWHDDGGLFGCVV